MTWCELYFLLICEFTSWQWSATIHNYLTRENLVLSCHILYIKLHEIIIQIARSVKDYVLNDGWTNLCKIVQLFLRVAVFAELCFLTAHRISRPEIHDVCSNLTSLVSQPEHTLTRKHTQTERERDEEAHNCRCCSSYTSAAYPWSVAHQSTDTVFIQRFDVGFARCTHSATRSAYSTILNRYYLVYHRYFNNTYRYSRFDHQ